MNRTDQDIFARLIELTTQGRIPWMRLYDDATLAEIDQELEDAAHPRGYVADDHFFGFGRLILQLDDTLDEAIEPFLNISGERLSISDNEIGLLRDEIESYFDRVMTGGTEAVTDTMKAQIEKELRGIRADNDEVFDTFAQLSDVINSQADMVREITTLAQSAHDLARDTMTSAPAASSKSGSEDTSVRQTPAGGAPGLPLTADSLRECLRVLIAEMGGPEHEVDYIYSEELLEQVVAAVQP
jgi:hypothetical protein